MGDREQPYLSWKLMSTTFHFDHLSLKTAVEFGDVYVCRRRLRSVGGFARERILLGGFAHFTVGGYARGERNLLGGLARVCQSACREN